MPTIFSSRASRRGFLRSGLYAVGVSAGLPAVFRQLAAAGREKRPDRIPVVLELAGGNAGCPPDGGRARACIAPSHGVH